jgi:hypothetical protein
LNFLTITTTTTTTRVLGIFMMIAILSMQPLLMINNEDTPPTTVPRDGNLYYSNYILENRIRIFFYVNLNIKLKYGKSPFWLILRLFYKTIY